jgi:hypothetical protein
MSCNHKFQTSLAIDHLDFDPTTLIVGTFVPEWPVRNQADWFYGRTHDAEGSRSNYFWDVLPGVYGAPGLADTGPDTWKRFCHDKRIAITDLISSIDDADPGNPAHCSVLASFSDKAIAYNFEDFTFVNIVQLLKNHPAIQNVYLTRGISESFWRHVWNPVMYYCKHNNIRERRLLTPSQDAAYLHEAHNIEHPDAMIPRLEEYILMRWRLEWHL